MGKSLHYHSLAWDTLKIIGGGAVLASMFVAPNLGKALGPFIQKSGIRERREWERQRVSEALKRLRERRYVRYEERGKNTYITITEKGKKRLRQFEFDTVALPEPPRHWDRKWRVVIFDVPEKKKRERKIFRDKLDNLGFLALQRSVYVYPHSCEDEVDFLCQFIDVDRYVHYIEPPSLGSAEGRARKHFDLI